MRRLRLVPHETHYNFFKYRWITFGASAVAMVASVILWLTVGLNFGIDFKGGTTIRTETTQEINVGSYRSALAPLGLGDVTITEVFDPSFGPDKHVASIRIQAQEGAQSVQNATMEKIKSALTKVDPAVKFTSIDSVGPTVSGELVKTAFLSVGVSLLAILAYIWLRFEWQFALGAVFALFHDVLVTIGVFSLFQIKFDLTVVAALLTIIGYSINDTVVIFDRLRENLRKFKKMPLIDVMNLSVNETLSRTVMTSGTTLIALIALLILGGDVIRGFVFAITFGVVVGTYSSVYVAKNVVLWLGVKRDWSKDGKKNAGTKYANIDA